MLHTEENEKVTILKTNLQNVKDEKNKIQC